MKANAETESLVTEQVIDQTSQNMPILSAALNSNPDPAQGGAEIQIKDDALVAALTPDGSNIIEAKITGDAIAVYTVQPGDTLSGIAKLFQVSRNTIKWANGIKYDDYLVIGQEIVILPIEGVHHEVKEGDTLASITKKYEGDIQEVANFNEISVNATLAVGSKIVVPGGVDKEAAKAVVWNSGSRAGVSAYTPGGIFIKPTRGKKTQGAHGRGGRAIDFGAPQGTAVVAAADGKVIISRSGWNGGYGNYIVIEHANISSQTLYAHLLTRNVSAGTWVKQGQKIGTVGNTGRSTGPHVHFEVRGKYRNPF